MGAIYGYAQGCTTGQKLDDQLEALAQAGVTDLYQESVPAAAIDSPQLNALLDCVTEGDTVVVTGFDRIARNTRHLLEIVSLLMARGVFFRALSNNFDTSNADGKLMLTMLKSIVEFERVIMLERQAEGIARAKAEGRYRGRKPTARAKAKEVVELAGQGRTRQSIADELGIGVASVYRILKDRRRGEGKSISSTGAEEKAEKPVQKKRSRKKMDRISDDRQQSLFDF